MKLDLDCNASAPCVATTASTNRDAAIGLWILVPVLTSVMVLEPVTDAVRGIRSGYPLIADQISGILDGGTLVLPIIGLFALPPLRRLLHLRWRDFAIAGLLLVLVMGGGIGVIRWTRQGVYRDVAARAQAIVNAIRAFEKDRGRPPHRIEELDPSYLADASPDLLAWGANLHYRVDPRSNTWTIDHGFDPIVGIEYDPNRVKRDLRRGEQRFGDWIIRSCDP